MNTVKQQTVAIVVTHNRKTLLERCIIAIEAQSASCDIFIIDNASTDETPSLFTQDDKKNNERFFYFQLEKNLGGAGGFAHGIQIAKERGYDWYWTMDDDGYPHPDCLKNLLEGPRHSTCRTPLLLNDNTPDILLYPIVIDNKKYKTKLEISNEKKNFIEGVGFLFNGALLHSSLVRSIGLPDHRLFIWGDETEYTMRIKKNGSSITTVVRALFYHPRSVDEWKPLILGRVFILTAPPLRMYCYYRNYFYIYHLYNKKTRFIRWVLIEIAKRIIAGRWKDLALILKSFFDATHGIWGGEKKYLN